MTRANDLGGWTVKCMQHEAFMEPHFSWQGESAPLSHAISFDNASHTGSCVEIQGPDCAVRSLVLEISIRKLGVRTA